MKRLIFIISLLFIISCISNVDNKNIVLEEKIEQNIDEIVSINAVIITYEDNIKVINGKLETEEFEFEIDNVLLTENQDYIIADIKTKAIYKNGVSKKILNIDEIKDKSDVEITLKISKSIENEKRTVTYKIEFTDYNSIVEGSTQYIYEERPEIYDISSETTIDSKYVTLKFKVRDKKNGNSLYGYVSNALVDWGNGKTSLVTGVFDNVSVSHDYENFGKYDIIITAEDIDGYKMSKKESIELKSASSTTNGTKFEKGRPFLGIFNWTRTICSDSEERIFTYTDNRVTEVNEYDAGYLHYTYKFEYNTSGNVEKFSQYDEIGDLIEITNCVYNSDGYILQERVDIDGDSTVEITINYTWNKEKVIKMIVSDISGSDIETDFTYDDKGRLQSVTTILEYEHSGTTYREESIIEYSNYDSNGMFKNSTEVSIIYQNGLEYWKETTITTYEYR